MGNGLQSRNHGQHEHRSQYHLFLFITHNGGLTKAVGRRNMSLANVNHIGYRHKKGEANAPADTVSVIEMNAPPSQLFISRADSPFGPLLLASTTQGLAHLWLDMDGRSEDELRARYPKAQIIEQTTPHHSAALSYFSNTPQPLTLHLKGTPFQLISMAQSVANSSCSGQQL